MRDYPYIVAALLTATLAILAFAECGHSMRIDMSEELTMEEPKMDKNRWFKAFGFSLNIGQTWPLEWDKAVAIWTGEEWVPIDRSTLIFPDSGLTQKYRRWGL